MSRKQLRTPQDENREWAERQRRQREEARLISEEQRRRQAIPGFRRLAIEEEI